MNVARAVAATVVAWSGAGSAGAEERCDRRVDSRNVIYRNGEVDLSGEWLRPDGSGPTPAVVILQGSGSADRNNGWAAMIAESIAKCGVAVLLTDKRGAGESGGDWRTASMLDLAADGAAGLKWAAGQPGVDPARLGFVGLSQGGHVAPAAAAASPEADFVVSLVGDATPMKETLFHELEQEYRAHGLDQPTIDYLQGFAAAAFRFVETGRGWDEYLRLHREISAGPLAKGAETWPDYPTHWYWTFWRKNHAYDPVPYWRQAVVDRGLLGLSIQGERDLKNVDVPTTVRRLRAEVPSERLLVEVIPGVGHSLRTESGEIHPRVISLVVQAAKSPGRRPN